VRNAERYIPLAPNDRNVAATVTTLIPAVFRLARDSTDAIQFATRINPTWLAMTRDVHVSRPDVDEMKLVAAR
jgi:hypothetical protein